MNRLQDIGFYTLSNGRARNVYIKSPMWRCELIITSKCNFNCPYCRGTDSSANISVIHAKKVIDVWAKDKLKNIRFSGGEPTMVNWLPEIVSYAKESGTERIAISTNGSAGLEHYKYLIKCGVNDFSISLDACCSDFGDRMAGVKGVFGNIVNNIRELSKLAYVTTGCVFDEKNIEQSVETVVFAHELGVADIRILTSAQYDKSIEFVTKIPSKIVECHPILKYRVNNFKNNRNVRGLSCHDSSKCSLVIDDSVVKGFYHYPCIIYLREDGVAIGEISETMREDRYDWFLKHNPHDDEICRDNCLDVCIDYNNRVKEINNMWSC